MGHAGFEVGMLAGVGERVGRRVDDAHEQRPAAELEDPVAEPQPHARVRLTASLPARSRTVTVMRLRPDVR
jgi:hypothetical protein